MAITTHHIGEEEFRSTAEQPTTQRVGEEDFATTDAIGEEDVPTTLSLAEEDDPKTSAEGSIVNPFGAF